MLNRCSRLRRGRAEGQVRVAALVVGVAATLTMGVVGCTSIVGGNPAVDTSAVPAYRSSVVASLSASAATSSSRESQRQQSLTTRAVRGSCQKFASSSTEAIEMVNKYVDAFNSGGDVDGAASPAVDALNLSADTVSDSIDDALSPDLRDTFNSYAEAARSVANAISTGAPAPVYNSRKDALNSIRDKGMQLCKTY